MAHLFLGKKWIVDKILRPTVAARIYTYSRRMREVVTFFDHS